MEKIVIRNLDELYIPGSEQIDWTKEPQFEFDTEVDALQTLQMLGEDLRSAREQVRQVMRYIQAAAVAARNGTQQDGKVKPQAIINHTGLARQTVYDMIGEKE